MISVSEMRTLEEHAEQKGVSKFTLMENAGREAARVISEKFDVKGKRILVVCYHGNNGGDGFVAARYLAEKAEVEVLFFGNESDLKPEARDAFDKIENDVKIQFIGLDYVDFDEYDIIVDAILGIGIVGELKPVFISTIDHINESKAKKVSIDVPSGLDADMGEVHNKMVEADLIITFHDLKKGLEKLKDKTVVVDIGIPKES